MVALEGFGHTHIRESVEDDPLTGYVAQPSVQPHGLRVLPRDAERDLRVPMLARLPLRVQQ